MARSSARDGFYDVWATAWGPVGAVAGPEGIRRFVLPHYQPDDLADLLAWEHRGAVRDAAPFRRLVELTRAYFNGQAVDFAEIACELPAPGSFAGKVLRACRTIPYGRTRSYVSLADQVGWPDGARAAAQALGRNRVPLIVPCHRVVYAGGGAGGFSAPGGTEMKLRLLRLEAGSP